MSTSVEQEDQRKREEAQWGELDKLAELNVVKRIKYWLEVELEDDIKALRRMGDDSNARELERQRDYVYSLLAAEGYGAPEEFTEAARAMRENKLQVRTREGVSAGNDQDRLLTAREAAEELGVSVKTVYKRHHEYPFTRRIGRSLRFSEQGLRDWLQRQADG